MSFIHSPIFHVPLVHLLDLTSGALSPRCARGSYIGGAERLETDERVKRFLTLFYSDEVEWTSPWREVTPENLLRVLTNRHPPGTPRSKKMLTDTGSNLLFFLTGRAHSLYS